MQSMPLASGRMNVAGAITELSAQQVAKLIKDEAGYLTLDVIRSLPIGKEIVSSTGVLKKRVSLGKVIRVYSLMDNQMSSAEAKLVETHLSENDLNDNIVRETLKYSFQRDLSDRYMATVNVAGLGIIGYVSAPVYSVYKDFDQLNWVDLKITQRDNKTVQSSSNGISSMTLGSLNNRILKRQKLRLFLN